MTRRILVVDDEESIRRVLQFRLDQEGYPVDVAEDAQQAIEFLNRQPYALVISDVRMPGMSGIDLLHKIRAAYPATEVVLLTAFGAIESAVAAMKQGAFDYLTKPIEADELFLVVQRALERRALTLEVQSLRAAFERKYGFENMLGQSPSLLEVIDSASRAAPSDVTILIRGETGTGKEVLAKAIHAASPRKDRPFVPINCGAIPKELLESELFGHVKGSFTGAVAHKKGKVESAEGGTLFLDEIGELPLDLQVKILRVLQEREIQRVGGLETTKVNVRVITATHRNLQAMMDDGLFRNDLYYRLAVIPLEIPPLRERPEDVPELVFHFFSKAKHRMGRPDLILPDELLAYFSAYRWPGNVRELENVMERVVVMARGNEITVMDLPRYLREQPSPVEAIRLELPAKGISLEAVERELIVLAVKRFDWNQTQAAQYLDISRKTLIYRMEKFGLAKESGMPDEKKTGGLSK